MEYPVLPFRIESIYSGFANCTGLLILKSDKIIFEFQTTDNFVGLIKSNINNVELTISKIESVEGKFGLFSSRVSVRAYSMSFLKDIPGSKQGEIVLKIKKRDREKAKELVQQIKFMIANYRLDTLD